MDRIVDSVEVELFSEGSQFFFTSAGTLFSSSAEFEVFLRIRRNDFAEEFSKFCCVFSFFKSDAFVGFRNFRIALTVSNTAHSEVHADFAAFASKVEVEAFDNAFVNAFSDTYAMFVSIFFYAGNEFCEFRFRSAALNENELSLMQQIIHHFTDNDAYTFSCQYYVLQTYPRAEVEYTFFDRNNTVYPEGFAELVNEQLGYMPQVIITEEEIDYMKRRIYYLPEWYFTFLRGYRFDPHEVTVSQDEEGHLDISVRGKWYSTIMWEMPILSIVSELMHNLRGENSSYNPEREYERCVEKTHRILTNELILCDMGTRRRLSFDHQNMVVRTMKEVYEQGGFEDEEGFHQWTGKFTGTSNVYLAMKYDLMAVGTMSHQIIEFEENVSGIFECNFNVMKKFSDVYDGDNGIYLMIALATKCSSVTCQSAWQ